MSGKLSSRASARPRSRALAELDDDVRVLVGVALTDAPGMSIRFGLSPLDGLGDVSAEVAAARAISGFRRAMAQAYPNVGPSAWSMTAARVHMERALRRVTDEEAERAAAIIRARIGDVPAAKSGAELLAAARREVEELFPVPDKGATRLVLPKQALGKTTAFDLLGQLEDRSDAVAAASAAFQQATRTGEASLVRANGLALQAAIAQHGRAAGLKTRQMDRCSKAIGTVMRSFERTAPTPDAAKAVRAFHAGIQTLDSRDEIALAIRRLGSWLSDADVRTIAEAVTRMPAVTAAGKSPEELSNLIRQRVRAVQGILGEIIGKKGTYRRFRRRQRARAHRFVESAAGRRWVVLDATTTPIRGLVPSKGSFAQFYDDAILLIDHQQKKVAVVLATQIKSGDLASFGVLQQIDRDMLRSKMLIDGVQYEIETGVIEAERAIIVSSLGVKEHGFMPKEGLPPRPLRIARALGDKDLVVHALPVNPLDLQRLAALFLVATRLIPAG